MEGIGLLCEKGWKLEENEIVGWKIGGNSLKMVVIEENLQGKEGIIGKSVKRERDLVEVKMEKIYYQKRR